MSTKQIISRQRKAVTCWPICCALPSKISRNVAQDEIENNLYSDNASQSDADEDELLGSASDSEEDEKAWFTLVQSLKTVIAHQFALKKIGIDRPLSNPITNFEHQSELVLIAVICAAALSKLCEITKNIHDVAYLKLKQFNCWYNLYGYVDLIEKQPQQMSAEWNPNIVITEYQSKCNAAIRCYCFLGMLALCGNMFVRLNKRFVACNRIESNSTNSVADISFAKRKNNSVIPETRVSIDLVKNAVLSDKSHPPKSSDEVNENFECLKRKLCEVTSLAHPNKNAVLALFTDSSEYCIGAALHQSEPDGSLRPLAFFSKGFRGNQAFKTIFEKELIAAKVATVHFRDYLRGRRWELHVDNKALFLSLTSATTELPLARQNRYRETILDYLPEVFYISGIDNTVADALSRPDQPPQSIEECEQENLLQLNAARVQFEPVTLQKIADEQEVDVELRKLRENESKHRYELKSVMRVESSKPIWCDLTEKDKPSVFVPATLRNRVFRMLHSLHHGGSEATLSLIKQSYVWPGMKKDIRKWTSECENCQLSKFHRHNRAQWTSVKVPNERFAAFNIDIMGKLPLSRGMQYALIAIDRFTRWVEVVTLPDKSCASVIRGFMEIVAKFGCIQIQRIISDNDPVFTSAEWQSLMTNLGISHSFSLPYLARSNGMCERAIKSLKISLRCKLQPESWVDQLPTVLLASRACVKPDLGFSAFEMVYGCSVRLPHALVAPQHVTPNPDTSYVARLYEFFANLEPTPTKIRKIDEHVEPRLAHAEWVYVISKAFKIGLNTAYTGPYRVLERGEHHLVLSISGKPARVALDHVKAAVLPDEFRGERNQSINGHATSKSASAGQNAVNETSSGIPSESEQSANQKSNFTGRHGRVINPPAYLDEYDLSTIFIQ